MISLSLTRRKDSLTGQAYWIINLSNFYKNLRFPESDLLWAASNWPFCERVRSGLWYRQRLSDTPFRFLTFSNSPIIRRWNTGSVLPLTNLLLLSALLLFLLPCRPSDILISRAHKLPSMPTSLYYFWFFGLDHIAQNFPPDFSERTFRICSDLLFTRSKVIYLIFSGLHQQFPFSPSLSLHLAQNILISTSEARERWAEDFRLLATRAS